MHRDIRDHVEAILAGTASGKATEHVRDCDECRSEIEEMSRHAAMLRQLKAPGAEHEVQPGFYARVLERIEAQTPASIWSLFTESAFGRRIAVASVALALLMGAYLVTTERNAEDPLVVGESIGESGVRAGADSAATPGVSAQALPSGAGSQASASLGANAPGREAANGRSQGQAGDEVIESANVPLFRPSSGAIQQVINQMDAADSEDQVLVNLATYREQ